MRPLWRGGVDLTEKLALILDRFKYKHVHAACSSQLPSGGH